MQINTALILCAGFGKRLLPLTKTEPKPLLKIGETTLLEKTIKLIEQLKIKKIKINIFYLSDQIKKFVKQLNTNIDIELIEDGAVPLRLESIKYLCLNYRAVICSKLAALN